MSLIIPTVARLKPEIRLAEAVSQFEASLSAAQKANFRTDRSKALESPPGPGNVMRLTADIDRSQRAGSRCFGPRFTNFLHGVQQFAALGDVIIGGSQNIVACGVWSLVRMSLLVSVTVVGTKSTSNETWRIHPTQGPLLLTLLTQPRQLSSRLRTSKASR
jgi:hypothetical protein